MMMTDPVLPVNPQKSKRVDFFVCLFVFRDFSPIYPDARELEVGLVRKL